MAKTVLFDYVLMQDGQTLPMDLQDYSAVISARVKFRGKQIARYGPLEYKTTTNTGTNSASFPSPPSGYTFEKHLAIAFVTITNTTATIIHPSVILATPFGLFTASATLRPGESIELSPSGISYSNHVGQSISFSVNADGGTGSSRVVAADTTGWRRPIVGYDQTTNPLVSIGEHSAGHVGELADGIETDWIPLAGLNAQLNNLAVAVEGSYQVDIQVEVTVEPLLPAPEPHNPERDARIDNRQPLFEFTLTADQENSASLYHARARISEHSTMINSIVLESPDLGTWEYLNGDTWEPFSPDGVSPGSRVRARPPQELNYKTYYWDCALHDGYSYGANSSPHNFRVMVAVVNEFAVVHNNVELTKITAISITETGNGELGEFEISMSIWTAEGQNAFYLLGYGDTIILAVNDTMGNTEEYHGVVVRKEPLGDELLKITAATGDRILAERIVKEDYQAQDIGLTVKAMIETYCAPLTANNVNINTGILAPVQSKDKAPISVLESIRKNHGIYYFVDKDWDFHFYKTEDIESAIVQLQYGEGTGF